jgi:hypothetical protein
MSSITIKNRLLCLLTAEPPACEVDDHDLVDELFHYSLLRVLAQVVQDKPKMDAVVENGPSTELFKPT